MHQVLMTNKTLNPSRREGRGSFTRLDRRRLHAHFLNKRAAAAVARLHRHVCLRLTDSDLGGRRRIKGGEKWGVIRFGY